MGGCDGAEREGVRSCECREGATVENLLRSAAVLTSRRRSRAAVRGRVQTISASERQGSGE